MRIVIVVNKWWECEPAINAMLNSNACPPGFPFGSVADPKQAYSKITAAPWPTSLNSPLPRTNKEAVYTARASFTYKGTDKSGNSVDLFTADIFCISDMMNAVPGSQQSSSSAKADCLKAFFKQLGACDLVIAVGTASSASVLPNRNGGVAIGTAVFLHNAHPPKSDPNPLSNWNGPSDEVIPSTISKQLFSDLAGFDAGSALQHFLPVHHRSDAPIASAGFHDVALATVNVTNYGEYKFKDRETLEAYLAAKNTVPTRAASIETTHGLIALAAGSTPFLFLSSITDRFASFDGDVSTGALADAQNTACAYNAGVTLRWMLFNLALQKQQRSTSA